MAIQNQEIAELFLQAAQLLEIDGANPFRARAYANAAFTIGNWTRSVADMVRQNEELSLIPGVGKDLAEQLKQLVLKGKLPQREELLQRLPVGLLHMLKIPGLGPKRVGVLYRKLNLTNLEQLRIAADAGTLKTLGGFGPKLEQQIRAGLDQPLLHTNRRLWAAVKPVADDLVQVLRKIPGVGTVIPAGSFRRGAETVGDLDLVATASDSAAIMEAFVHYEDVGSVVANGETRATVLFHSGLQVDLRVVPEAGLGAALQYFTGSQAHNVALRTWAQEKKLKLNEYGVYKGTRRLGGNNETEVYGALGLPYIDPELREGRGELEAAQSKTLPILVSHKDIRGDLHAHTHATDGTASLEDMVQAARDRGYTYLAITDHSQRVTVAHGLDAHRLTQQLDAIDRLNEKLKGFTILKGMEVDILDDGSLDLSEPLLKRLDLTVCSIHSKFNLSANKQTERILRAMDNPHFTILGHPTGRLINERQGYPVEMERIIQGAKERGCFLELNSHPARLDLTDIYCRMAKELGVKISISTDAHSVRDFEQIHYGLNQARRGWLDAKAVLNTHSLKDLKRLMRRK
jgi:DNA polymerase (family 10)